MLTIKEFLEEKKEELKQIMDDISIDFANDCNYKDSGWINDSFVSYASESVDVYNHQLLNWVAEDHNYNHIEEYYNEFGMPEKIDFFEMIRNGQFYKNYNKMYQEERNIKQLIYINKLLNLDDEIINQKLDEELENNIENILDGSWCDLDTYEEYEDVINETFGWN